MSMTYDVAAATGRLNSAVAQYVSKGWAVQDSTPTRVVLFKKKRMGIFWNLVLTVVTAGLWAIVWIVRAINGKGKSKVLLINQVGMLEEH